MIRAINPERASSLKNAILKLMEDMKSFQAKYPKAELPKPSNDFILAEELLAKGDFNLAVCGKVKNGKSSLINALIGRRILPECNDVATSRVFKISHAEADSFFIVYSNGDMKEITLKELAQYGSQAAIDMTGELSFDKAVAYIQVNTPIDFLPEGVSIIDTPGIGSTYPQHTAITKQFLKYADAALFVLNPTPMEDVELTFLKEIVDVSPSIMFVTTKTDLHGDQVIEDTMRRNKKLISKAIGSKLFWDVTMLKMSSTTLMEAAQTPDKVLADFNYEVSGYAEVKNAIQNTVFLTIGYYRVGIAYNTAVAYYQTILKALQNRKDTSLEAASKYDELLAEYEKANNDFTAKVGDAKRKELLNNMEVILKTMEADFNIIFATSGDICRKYTDEIEALTVENINSYGDELGNRLTADIKTAWDNLVSLVQRKVTDLLVQYDEDCKMSIPENIKISVVGDVQDPQIQDLELRERVGKMRTEMFMGTAVTGALGTLLGGAYYFFPAVMTPVLPVLAPVMVLLGVGAVLWGAISGNNKARQEKLQKNKDQLVRFVYETLASCRKELVEVSLADNKYQSLYQGFMLAMRKQATDAVDSTYERYKSELCAMKAAIVKSKQDPEYIKAISQLINGWSLHKDVLNKIHSALESFNK